MGTNIGKITTIVKSTTDPISLSGSLQKIGRQRMPGAQFIPPPHREVTGEFRTGLDPNAKYIQKLAEISPEAAKLEKDRVTKELERIKALINDPSVDLSPRSDFYLKMYAPNPNNEPRCVPVRLQEGTNVFNLDDPWEAITFAYARVMPEVAPSLQFYKEGRANPGVLFYVEDESFEQEIAHKDNLRKAKAIGLMTSFTVEKQAKIARLLGCSVSTTSEPAIVFNELYSFINATNNRINNVELFEAMAALADSDLTVKYYIEEAIAHNIYRMVGPKVFEGSNEMAKSKEDLLLLLRDPEHQDLLISLQEKLKFKQLAAY